MKGFDAPELTRLGWEAMTPLESDPVKAGLSPHVLKQTSASFLSINPSVVVVTTWKLAEDGDGSILRLEETAGKVEAVHISIPNLVIKQAWICNALEDKQSELAVGPNGIHLSVPAFGIVTIRLKTEPENMVTKGPA